MPELSRFYGIIVRMYALDHPPPHLHVRYAEHQALIAIADGSVIAGRLPRRALRLVREWMALHLPELRSNWERARVGEAVVPIAPLP